jgi:site-specific recombinase XerC
MREHVEMFLERELDEQKPSTVATRFRSLRLFWRWCVEESEVQASPMERMRPPTIPESPVPVIPEADLRNSLSPAKARASQSDATSLSSGSRSIRGSAVLS